MDEEPSNKKDPQTEKQTEEEEIRNKTNIQLEEIRQAQKVAADLVSGRQPLEDLFNEFFDAPNFLKKLEVGTHNSRN